MWRLLQQVGGAFPGTLVPPLSCWNTITSHSHLHSGFLSPQTEETSFHFDGSGFSLVQKSLRATSTSIVLLFKTLSPGGLLLYLASNNTVHVRTHTHTHDDKVPDLSQF